MPYAPFHVLHLISVLLLVGITFMAFSANQLEYRRPVLMWSGIAALVALLTGFGLLGVMKWGFPGWAIVKLICWFIISGVAGIAYRKRDKTKPLMITAIAAIVVAVLMVSLKPF